MRFLGLILFFVPLVAGCPNGVIDDVWFDTAWDDRPDEPDVDVDTDTDTDTDPESSDTLTFTVTGTWDLTPAGGPYTAMTGAFSYEETLTPSGTSTPTPVCDLAYALAGTASAEGCTGCTFTFTVTHDLQSGTPGDCYAPDVLDDDEVRTMGFRPSEGAIVVDWADTGAWVPLYTATLAGDQLSFTWTNTVLYQD
jgi:hypothetical protein